MSPLPRLPMPMLATTPRTTLDRVKLNYLFKKIGKLLLFFFSFFFLKISKLFKPWFGFVIQHGFSCQLVIMLKKRMVLDIKMLQSKNKNDLSRGNANICFTNSASEVDFTPTL